MKYRHPGEKHSRRHLTALFTLLVLTLVSLACSLLTAVPGMTFADLAGKSYWAAETATPIPTVTIFLGTTTPVLAPTNPPVNLTVPPVWITTTPEWTTITPIFSNTPTPYWVTTTPLWLTSTPEYITSTPEPPETTTPALPIIGFSTPEPLETAYYRVGTFYYDQDVYVGSPYAIVFNVQNHTTQDSPNDAAATYHFVELIVKNYTGNDDIIVPVADIFFIREVRNGGEVIRGRWGVANEPLLANELPLVSEQQQIPLNNDEERSYTLGFILPDGDVDYMGLVTDWDRPVAGGLPIWFLFEDDPGSDAPYTSAYRPPPPTPILFDENNTYTGGGGGITGTITPPPPGIGSWPTNGSVTRGFGCSAFYTGVDGAGWGCVDPEPWFHNGVDIANVNGNPIYTPIDGAMTWAGPNATGPDCSYLSGSDPPHEGLGNYQIVEGGGLRQYFGHLSGFLITSGSINQGQQISYMGSTGCSTGSHLHWMIYQSGNLIDPAWWAGPGPPP